MAHSTADHSINRFVNKRTRRRVVRRPRVARKAKLSGVNISPPVAAEVTRVVELQKAAYLGTFDTRRSVSDVIESALRDYLAKFRQEFELGAEEIPDQKLNPEEFAALVQRMIDRRTMQSRSGSH